MLTKSGERKVVPEVSVIIPTFNRCDLLRQTLDSVIAQTFEGWEAIVVDDGSTDDSFESVYARSECDNRIRIVRRTGEATGANVCRNQGARLSNAALLIFLDSDDLLSPECLEYRIQWMARNQDFDFAVCHANAFLDFPGDLNRPASVHSLDGDIDRFLYFDLPWLITGPIWRREAFLKLGGFNEQIPSWQDVELHVRAILKGLSYQNLPITDYHVRWQNDPSKTSLQQRRNERHLRYGEATVDMFEQLLEDHAQLTWSRLRGIACLRLMLAEMWSNINQWSEAKKTWKRMKVSPASSFGLYYGGLLFLLAKRMGIADVWIIDRFFHRWRGAARLRSQPQLVVPIKARAESN